MQNETKKNKIKRIALLGVMLALILALQMVSLPNFITGIIVNAIFIFIVLYSDVFSGICLCFISPIGGIISGHVPVLMYPVLPIIATGNILYVIFFNMVSHRKKWIRFLLPSLIKAIVIGVGGWLIVKYYVSEITTNWIITSVLFLQFFTAILGVWAGERLFKAIKKD